MSVILRRLTFLVLKLMGIKKIFSKSPIDYKKLRKTDQKNPSKRLARKFNIHKKKVENSEITIISTQKDSDKLIIYIPGGAFVSGPAAHHWDGLEKIIQETQKTIWLIDYPKAPEANINQINKNIDAIYQAALSEFSHRQIIFIGDSVGANLIMSLVQRLINKTIDIPSKLILITPVFDSSMTNPNIKILDKTDPMLSRAGVLSAKMMCAQEVDLKDPQISPLYGSFSGFPDTMLFICGKDIMHSDGLLGAKKMKKASVNIEVINELEMPHIYPLLPIMRESKQALSKIIDKINS